METEPAKSAQSRSSAHAQATMQFLLRLRERGVGNLAVLRALETIPREHFVPHRHADLAWRDIALPIPCGQTMPEPFVVARMAEALAVQPAHRILEIGTGNGYAAAILSRLGREVVSVERFKTLALAAQTRLVALGLENVKVVCADGLALGEDIGLFDRILVHGIVRELPESVVSHLAEGGIILFGEREEGAKEAFLIRLVHGQGGFKRERLAPCRLQPLIAGVSP